MVGMHGPWGVLDLAAYSSGVPCMGRLNVCLPLAMWGSVPSTYFVVYLLVCLISWYITWFHVST